jgi:hypothetical protein
MTSAVTTTPPATLTDREFLAWCSAQAFAPNCPMTPAQLARLYRLAGYSGTAGYWEYQPDPLVHCRSASVLQLVRVARMLTEVS